MNLKKINKRRGFTLIEVLVVIGIVAILAGIVLVAINPARQFKQARDAQRVSNVNVLLNAIGQRMADGKGVFAGTVGGSDPEQICPDLRTGSAPLLDVDIDYSIVSDNDDGVIGQNIHIGCLSPTYIPVYPIDPLIGVVGGDTGYDLRIDTNGRITIKAPAGELSAISVTR